MPDPEYRGTWSRAQAKLYDQNNRDSKPGWFSRAGAWLGDRFSNFSDRFSNFSDSASAYSDWHADKRDEWRDGLQEIWDNGGPEKTLALMNGLNGIAGTVSGLIDISDTPQYQGYINSINQVGTTDYGSYNQLAMGYNQVGSVPTNFDYDTIRGGSDAERIGSVLSSTVTGATTGATVGGPWGALAGGAIGLGAGLFGVATGNDRARMKQKGYDVGAQYGQYNAYKNLGAQRENIADHTYRMNVNTMKAKGGPIERKQQTLQEFADRVLKTQRANDRTHSAGIVRERVDGGTRIRIKVK